VTNSGECCGIMNTCKSYNSTIKEWLYGYHNILACVTVHIGLYMGYFYWHHFVQVAPCGLRGCKNRHSPMGMLNPTHSLSHFVQVSIQ